MTKLVDLPSDVYKYKLTHGFFDDFNEGVVTADRWTVSTDTDGTAVVSQTSTAGGILDMMTAAVTAGNEWELVVSTVKSFFFAANKPLVFGCRCSVTESNTDDASALIGVSNAITEATLVDTTGVPIATENYGAYFYKSGNTTPANEWRVGHQNNTTATNVALTAANSLDGKSHISVSGTMQLLEFACIPTAATAMDVLYYINGVHVYKSSVSFTAAKAMAVMLEVKDLAAGNEDFLNVDYVYCYQTR